MVAAITFVHLTVLFIQILLQLWHTMALQGYKCCEIDTVSLTYGSLQVLPWNNITTIEKMDSCDWWSEIIHFFQYIHFWNQRDIISNSDIFLLQLLFCKNTVDLKEYTATTVLCNGKRVIHRMRGCNWNCEYTSILFKCLSNILYVRNSWLQVLF